MNAILRKTALAGALGLCYFVSAADGFAQTDATGKDLNVEVAPSAPYHPRPHHPHHPAPPVMPAGPVQVSITPVGPSVLSIGQPLHFRMVALSDGYAQLYVLSASGRTQLWLENLRVHAGQPIGYPRPGLVVRAAPPAGDDTVLFAVTRTPIVGFVGGTSWTPFDLQYTHDGLRAALQQKLDTMPRSDWAIAEISVRVQE